MRHRSYSVGRMLLSSGFVLGDRNKSEMLTENSKIIDMPFLRVREKIIPSLTGRR